MFLKNRLQFPVFNRFLYFVPNIFQLCYVYLLLIVFRTENPACSDKSPILSAFPVTVSAAGPKDCRHNNHSYNIRLQLQKSRRDSRPDFYVVFLFSLLKESAFRLDQSIGISLSLIYNVDFVCLCIAEHKEIMS